MGAQMKTLHFDLKEILRQELDKAKFVDTEIIIAFDPENIESIAELKHFNKYFWSDMGSTKPLLDVKLDSNLELEYEEFGDAIADMAIQGWQIISFKNVSEFAYWHTKEK
jgi:hypothetical protein